MFEYIICNPVIILSAIIYIPMWIGDIVEYWYVSLILGLPHSMFSTPYFTITQSVKLDSQYDKCGCGILQGCRSDSENSEDNEYELDSSDEECEVEYDIFIKECLFNINSDNNTYTKNIHGHQLVSFVDESGKFNINDIKKFYPDISSIDITYFKYLKDEYENYDNVLAFEELTKKIDVYKKMDIANNKSCRLGVVF